MIKRGVSFYSYQQSQFFKQLDLEGQIKELTQNLDGADGVEIIEELALPRYPNPPEAFFEKWYSWLEKYQAKPITMDTFLDVLQFRDHVMSYHESAERLKSDLRLAKKLGFENIRVLAPTPFEVIIEALPVAEEVGVKMGREAHCPMNLRSQAVTEVIEYAEKTGTKHLGIIPDMGMFQYRPSEVQLAWLVRHGASQAAAEVATELCSEMQKGEGPLASIDLSETVAATVTANFHRFVKNESIDKYFEDAFKALVDVLKKRVPNPTKMDYQVLIQCLRYSHCNPDDMERVTPYIASIHGKFYHMTEIPGKPGEYEDKCIDYDSPIAALKRGGFEGYINSEYEGQRYWHDLPLDQLASEVVEVRKHHKMLKRLIEA
jgi:hypothetical protein